MPVPLVPFDPFDLPDWVGTDEVIWSADFGLRGDNLVVGTLASATAEQVCDLMAVDEAYPEIATDDASRVVVHQAWHHGQVHVAERSGRLTLCLPGTRISAELALEALERLARSVGANPERFAVQLRIGADGRRTRR